MHHPSGLRRGLHAGAVAAALLALLLPSSAHAIVYGEPAKDGEHTNVGSFVTMLDPGNGEDPYPVQLCTGTLVSPTVVLTASHCMATWEWPASLDPTQLTFTLDKVIDADADWVVDEGVTLLSGTPVPHPAYADSSHYRYDVGAFVLDREVKGVPPAVLAAPGTLDPKSMRSEAYQAVGYGIVRETRRRSTQAFLPPARRMVADQPLTTVNRDFATFSMNQARGHGGTCYGDSGGPHFLMDDSGDPVSIVAVTTTGDIPCKATDQAYRVDTKIARDFLKGLGVPLT